MTLLVYKLTRTWESPDELWSLQVAGNTVRSFHSRGDAVQFGKQRVRDLNTHELHVKLIVYGWDGSIEEEYPAELPARAETS